MSLTDEQKRLRRTGIGSSEIAAVAGISPYAKPIDVWRSKVEGLEIEETEPMRRGRLLEPALANWYAETTGAALREIGTVRHKRSDIALATPDRIATLDGAERVLEIKTASFRLAENWGDTGTDDVPSHYLLQAQWEMACADLPSADLAVLIGGDDFRVYHLIRDLELEAMLLQEAEKFWKDFVTTKRPPPVDASENYGEWLARLPRKEEKEISAPPEAKGWANILEAARVAKEVAEEKEQEARNHLLALMGDASVMVGDGFKVSYRQTKGRAVTNWQALCASLQVGQDAIERFTERRPYRQFRPTFAQDKK